MNNKLTNLVVVGQGAIGLLWYHHLSQVSHQQNTKVTLLASNQKELSQHALTNATYQFTPYQKETEKQNSQSYPLTYCQLNDIESADVILLCLKSYKITEAIQSLVNNLSPNAIIILAHNGMGTFAEVAQLLPSEQVILAMLTTHGCLRHSPLNISHTGLGQSDIGLLSGELGLPEQALLAERFNQALPLTSFHQDIVMKQWLKLAINCVINPITAINNIDNGEVNSERFSKQVIALLFEITEVSKAEGIILDFEELKTLVSNVAKATAKNRSSMRSDILATKPTEIDYINGYIHRLGKKHNIATPANSQLWQQIKDLELS